jgi:hypothetical protein
MRNVQTAASGGTLPAGDYDYAVTASTPNGETTLSDAESASVAANGTAQVNWEAVCHATTYNVYRSPAGGTSWSKLATVSQPPTAFNDAGPATVTFTDTGAAAVGGAPPTGNTAVVSPYGQNANLAPALIDTGIRYTATDASKADGTAPAGSSFTVSGTSTQAVPRWPTNVYYNVATQTEQLDEYNWLYMPPPTGACTPIAGVTTCRTAPATWAEYVANEKQIMFRHLMGNDPRPHYFHESNIAETSNPEGGLLYKVVDALLADYRSYFADNAPLVQLNKTQAGDELARQDKWAQDVAAGRVTAYLLDGKVHVSTTATMDVPLTGVTGVGSAYGGQQSGWTTVKAGQEAVFPPEIKQPVTPAPNPPVKPVRPVKPAPKPPVGAPSAPRIQSLGVAPRTFAVARGKVGGTRISWRLSKAATLRLRFERSLAGRRSGRSCRPVTRANARRPKCRRYVSVGTKTLAARSGRGSVRFSGWLGRRTLGVGSYRLVAVANASGRTSAPRTVGFNVRAASKRARR